MRKAVRTVKLFLTAHPLLDALFIGLVLVAGMSIPDAFYWHYRILVDLVVGAAVFACSYGIAANRRQR